jgi:hypothetical protein
MKIRRAILVLLAPLGAATVWAQQPTPPPSAAPNAMEMPGKPGMLDEGMMARHKEMMAKMEAMDARLGDLVQKMNSAKGNRKADAVADVVNELVTQRKEMREQMMAMQPEMMKHMMEHMQKGMMKGMMECPMMKGMDGKPGMPHEHSEHRPN